jgi:hypothetical protein
MEEFERSVGAWLLAAAKIDMKAHEHDDLKHGLLTYTLLAGGGAVEHGPLSKRASPEKPWLTVRNWFGFAQDMVSPLSKVYFGEGEQAVELKGSYSNFPVLQSGNR